MLVGISVALFMCSCFVIYAPAEEDAFIYYRYALNYVRGEGLVFNSGEWVEAYSSFLWMWILVLLAILGIDLPVGAPIMSILCGGASLVVAYLLARKLDLGGFSRFATVFGMALFYPFSYWARSGLDTSFYTLLLTLFTLLYFSTQYSPHRPRFIRSWHQLIGGVLVLGVSLARPEGILLAFVVGIDRWLNGRDIRGALHYLGPTFAGYAVFLFFRYTTYGALSPNTSVKFTPLLAENGLRQTFSYFLYMGFLPLIIPAYMLFSQSMRRDKADPRFIFLVLMISIISIGFTVVSGGDYPSYFRFLIPTSPLLMLLFWRSLEGIKLGRKAGHSLTDTLKRACLIVLLFSSFICLIQNISQPNFWDKLRREWSNPFADDDNYHVTAARWILKNVPSGYVIAYGQMGKAPYYSIKAGKELTFIDTLGLTDAELGHILGMGNKLGILISNLLQGQSLREAYKAGRETVYTQANNYLLSRRPDIIIIESILIEKTVIEHLLSHAEFQRRYALRAKFSSETHPSFIVYERIRDRDQIKLGLNQTAAHLDELGLQADLLGVLNRPLKRIRDGVDTRIDESPFHLSLPGVGRAYAAHANRRTGVEDARDG